MSVRATSTTTEVSLETSRPSARRVSSLVSPRPRPVVTFRTVPHAPAGTRGGKVTVSLVGTEGEWTTQTDRDGETEGEGRETDEDRGTDVCRHLLGFVQTQREEVLDLLGTRLRVTDEEERVNRLFLFLIPVRFFY